MGKGSRTPCHFELQRRHDQSLWDRELQRRREQSARDRERHQRQQGVQARAFHRLLRRLTPVIALHASSTTSNIAHPSTRPFFPLLLPKAETMPPTVPWKQGPSSGRAFDSLFNNEKYSDVALYLGKSQTLFPAHQLVLGVRSPYFDDALQNKFKEGITHEFRFEKDSPQALWRVLRYICTGDYADASSESLDYEGDDLELLKHPRVYALADMFLMEDLKSLACRKFELQLQQHWISDTLVDCIREVYSTSTASADIRMAVVKIATLHMKDLVQRRPFQELVREVGDFAVDLVLVMADSQN